MLLHRQTLLHASVPLEPRGVAVSAEIETGTEPATGTGEHDHPHGTVATQAVKCGVKLLDHRRRHRVQLVGSVHPDEGNTVAGIRDLDFSHSPSCHD